MATEHETDTAVPAQATSSWSSFLKTISSFSGDLSSLTAPPFILSGTSLTEYSAYWVSHPCLLTRPAAEPDPERRAVLVLKWFISTLKQSYSSRNEKLGSEKKPLNPFLGELFLAKWEGEGNLTLISEQVSHHPPVTAYCIESSDKSVQLQGYNGQKASISRSLAINIKQVGRAVLRFPQHDETYLITLPSLHIEGLISGSPYVELNSHNSIVSSSGYTARIDYTGRGWISGKKNSFSAVIHRTGKPKEVLYTAEGQWTGPFVIKDANKAEVETYDSAHDPMVQPLVADVEQQGPLESRRAWAKVAEGIKAGDMEVTQKEKSLIENEQREMRKKEKEEGREWPRKYFERVESDDVFEELGAGVGETSEPEKTDGVWVFKEVGK